MNEYDNIKVGQVWVPDYKDDYTLEIMLMSEEEVVFKQRENGRFCIHELGGSDGFADYLEHNCYHLKV